MQRAQYRQKLKKAGIDIEGQDVGHIISKANGGADHQDNYYTIGSHVNRAMGNRNDDLNCYFAGPAKCRKAVKISRLIGSYNGPGHEELYERGKKNQKKAFQKSESKYEPRDKIEFQQNVNNYSDKEIVLFFYSNTCPSCIDVIPIINELDKNLAKLEIIRLDSNIEVFDLLMDNIGINAVPLLYI